MIRVQQHCAGFVFELLCLENLRELGVEPQQVRFRVYRGNDIISQI